MTKTTLGRPSRRPARGFARATVTTLATLTLLIAPACGQVVPAVAAQELQSGAGDPDVRRLYELNGWRGLWSEARAAELAHALRDAERHGLDAKGFAWAGGATPEQRELALTESALAYARALARGVVDPNEIHGIFTLERNQVDLARGLLDALEAGRLRAWLSSLAPNDAEYRALSENYLRERARIGAAGSEIPQGPLIRTGDHDPRVPAIASVLAEEGFLAELGQPTDLYGPDLARALEAFQRAKGLQVDGVVGSRTVDALNKGPLERARQLAVNLERRRWLARTPPATRIDVNTAAARLDYYRDGPLAWSTRVVAGTPGNPTPQLQETFDQLVLNPPWYVPQSIAREEILPKGRGYLVRNDMYVEDGRVIQRPGPQAALGQVKFDMQNRYAIYLHDTPAKALFETNRRHRSHGCVRVRDAVAFARRLAEERGRGVEFGRILLSSETGVVELGEAIPVRLMYHTAFVQDGQVVLRPDAYGWDARLAAALGLGGGGGEPDAEAVAADFGP